MKTLVCVLFIGLPCPRFGSPMDLIGKVEGTLLDYNNDFNHFKQA